MQPALLVSAARFISDTTLHATREVPRTPDGQNPFKVMDLELTADTSMDLITKQFKKQAVSCHPDRPGGSHEKMSELNAAYKIVKENLSLALDKLSEHKRNRAAGTEYRKMQNMRASKEEEIGRTGGIHNNGRTKRTNVAREAQHKYKTAAELHTGWETLQADTSDAVTRMIGRYEVAVEQALHFKKLTILHEISVRERWVRKMFVKNVWEQVHEMRQELLRKGARSRQQSELAEEMVAYATATERKLTEDFHRQAQIMVQGQLKVLLERIGNMLFWVTTIVLGLRWLFGAIMASTFSERYKEGFFSTGSPSKK